MQSNKKQEKLQTTHLKNIAQVTEEYNSSLKRDSISQKSTKDIEVIQPKIPVLKKYNACLEYLISFCRKTKKAEYDINESEITKEVEKLKRRKSKITPLLPPITQKTKTLVVDLDQTLIFSSFKKPKHYDFAVQIEIRGGMQKVYVTKRFGLDIFLFQMSQIFQIVLFTAGIKDYTDLVLQQIDPKKRIKHVLYRQHCTVLNKSYFIKNLRLLGRNLKQTILVDDNAMAGMMNYQIFYKIDPFNGSTKDRKLLRLIQFLKLISTSDNFECLVQKRKTFDIKNPRPASYFNHNLQGKAVLLQNISTDQSSELNSEASQVKQQNTGMQLVKNEQI